MAPRPRSHSGVATAKQLPPCERERAETEDVGERESREGPHRSLYTLRGNSKIALLL